MRQREIPTISETILDSNKTIAQGFGMHRSNAFYYELNIHAMRRHPMFAPLRGDPRFEVLLNDPKNNAPLF
jgi:hypothetical protein